MKLIPILSCLTIHDFRIKLKQVKYLPFQPEILSSISLKLCLPDKKNTGVNYTTGSIQG